MTHGEFRMLNARKKNILKDKEMHSLLQAENSCSVETPIITANKDKVFKQL